MTESYFTPVSLNDMIECIQKNIKNPRTELTGDELIYDVEYISGDQSNLPQNTVIFHLVKTDPETHEDMLGCLYVTPRKQKYLM